MPALSLETRQEGDAVRIAATGELDLANALTFEKEVRKAEDRQPRAVILDLRRLSFMDSTGLRLILSAHSRARKRERRLFIVLGTEPVKRIFRLAGVTRRLDIVEHPSGVAG
jgi:anti-sigma B factor antagonist